MFYDEPIHFRKFLEYSYPTGSENDNGTDVLKEDGAILSSSLQPNTSIYKTSMVILFGTQD